MLQIIDCPCQTDNSFFTGYNFCPICGTPKGLLKALIDKHPEIKIEIFGVPNYDHQIVYTIIGGPTIRRLRAGSVELLEMVKNHLNVALVERLQQLVK